MSSIRSECHRVGGSCRHSKTRCSHPVYPRPALAKAKLTPTKKQMTNDPGYSRWFYFNYFTRSTAKNCNRSTTVFSHLSLYGTHPGTPGCNPTLRILQHPTPTSHDDATDQHPNKPRGSFRSYFPENMNAPHKQEIDREPIEDHGRRDTFRPNFWNSNKISRSECSAKSPLPPFSSKGSN